MQIAGINTLTLIDFPNKTSCIVFTAGCNFRCGFCHNPHYVLPEKLKEYQDQIIPKEAFFNFLDTRKKLLDGVVISGGEPTLMSDLIPFIKQIRQKGFAVKLDTNGSNPEVIKQLIKKKLIDYFAMDIKTAPDKYAEIVNVPIEVETIKKSRDLIMQSGVDYEFRTTLIKEHHTQEVLQKMADFLKGAKKYTLQNFQKTEVLDPKYLNYSAFSEEELNKTAEFFRGYVGKVGVV